METEHLASIVTWLHIGHAALVQLLDLSGLSFSCVYDTEQEKEAMPGKQGVSSENQQAVAAIMSPFSSSKVSNTVPYAVMCTAFYLLCI